RGGGSQAVGGGAARAWGGGQGARELAPPPPAARCRGAPSRAPAQSRSDADRRGGADSRRRDAGPDLHRAYRRRADRRAATGRTAARGIDLAADDPTADLRGRTP